jgi:voltage-gated potassium channel
MKGLEKKEIYSKFWFAVGVFILLIVIGAQTYHMVEKWSYLDSFYFTVVTVTTIGYGDLAPHTPIGKLFTMFFPFIGIGLAFYLFSITGKYVLQKAMDEMQKFSGKVVK